MQVLAKSGSLRLSIEPPGLGPLSRGSLELGDLTLIVGPPGSGKSYILRAVYAWLSLLDPSLPRVCRMPPPSSRLRVSRDAVEVLARLLASLTVSALDAGTAPNHVAKKLGVPVTRYTVRGRSRGALWAELRIKREHQPVLLSYDLQAALSSLVASARRCLEGSLLPASWGARLEPVASYLASPELEKIVARRLGSTRLRLYPGIDARIQGCRISIGEVIVEASLGPRGAVLRGVEAEAAVHGRDCNTVPGEAESLISAALRSALLAHTEEATARANKAIARRVYQAARRAIQEVSGVTGVLYAPYSRSSVLALRLALGAAPINTTRLRRIFPVLRRPEARGYALLLDHIDRGLARLTEVGIEEPLLRHASRLLAAGGYHVEDGRIVYRDEAHRVELPLHLASALAQETAALILAANSLPEPPVLILLEEPEAQLHPQLQLAMGIVLSGLAAHGVKIAATTHSEFLAFAPAFIKARQPGPEELARLLRRSLEPLGASPPDESILAVAEAAAKLADARFYRTSHGRVEEVEPTVMLSEMPSLQEASNIMLEALLLSNEQDMQQKG